MRSLLIYATIWAFCTALMRPLSGGEWLDFIERSANWAAPLALLFFYNGEKVQKGESKDFVPKSI